MRAGILHPVAGQEYYLDEGCFITELSNGRGDPGLSIARARVEPGVTTRLHCLRGVSERYLILEGEGIVEVGELAPRRVAVGDVVLIPPRVSQRIHNSGGKDLVFLVLCTPRFTPTCYQDLEM